MLNVDLHCHSNISDGLLSPEQLVVRAKNNSVDLWALTDHDEISGIAAAYLKALDLDLRCIAGVEISVTWTKKTVHIIGLHIDINNIKLIQGLKALRESRKQRAKHIAKQLEIIRIPNSFEGALKHAHNRNLISRTHFARYLVEIGYCINIKAAFRYYLHDDKLRDIKHCWATLKEAIDWIHDANGVAVIAHPGRYQYTEFEFNALFDEFKQYGGVGIEVITSNHTLEQYQKYARIAKYYNFLASIGSDFHSQSESRFDLGKLPPLPSNLKPIWYNWN